MEPDGSTRAETEHEPVAANPFGGIPPWQRRSGFKRGLAGIGALILTVGSIAGVAWLAFRGDAPEERAVGEVLFETCRVTAADDAEPTVEPPQLDAPDDRVYVSVETNYGEIEILLAGDVAPCGVAAFLYLAESGFYDRHDCDRLTTQREHPTAVLRCGSPGIRDDSGATHGPGWRYRAEVGMEGVEIGDALALIADADGRGGSAFALIRGQAVPTVGVSIIGMVIDGYDVLDDIAALPPSPVHDGAPTAPVTVYGITVHGGEAPQVETSGTPEPDPETATPTGTPTADAPTTETPTGTPEATGTRTPPGLEPTTVQPGAGR